MEVIVLSSSEKSRLGETYGESTYFRTVKETFNTSVQLK